MSRTFARQAALASGFKAPGNTPWALRHNAAIQAPNAAEEIILQTCLAAQSVALRFKDDSFGVPNVVAPSIDAARAILNFDAGRLDCGTLDKALCDLAAHCGWNLDTGGWA